VSILAVNIITPQMPIPNSKSLQIKMAYCFSPCISTITYTLANYGTLNYTNVATLLKLRVS